MCFLVYIEPLSLFHHPKQKLLLHSKTSGYPYGVVVDRMLRGTVGRGANEYVLRIQTVSVSRSQKYRGYVLMKRSAEAAA